MYHRENNTTPWFRHVAAFILKTFLRFSTRWQVVGIKNVPPSGPVLIVSNHLSLMDPPLLGVSLNRRAIFMAKKELFQNRLVAYFLSGFGSFPVERGHFSKETLRLAERILSDGLALTMFPEGRRSKSGALERAFPGTALIAARSKVPVLPVGISGTEKMKGMSWLFKRPRLVVNIGQTFFLPATTNNRINKAELADCTDLIMKKIAALLPPEYRGLYSGKANEY